MKKSTAAIINHALLRSPVITRRIRPYYRPTSTPPPPSEETINRLNCIGREYPFCVYYREKKNDPL